jgi:RimJ/RimL family protein N-acetyltransferase
MPEVVAVVASTDADNVASQRVLEKAGFQLVDRRDGGRYRIGRSSLDDTCAHPPR